MPDLPVTFSKTQRTGLISFSQILLLVIQAFEAQLVERPWLPNVFGFLKWYLCCVSCLCCVCLRAASDHEPRLWELVCLDVTSETAFVPRSFASLLKFA